MVDVHPPSATAGAGAGGDDGDDRRPHKKQIPEAPDIPFDEAEDTPPETLSGNAIKRKLKLSGSQAEFKNRRYDLRTGASPDPIPTPAQGQKDDEEVVRVRGTARSSIPRTPPRIDFLPQSLQKGRPGTSRKLDILKETKRKPVRKSTNVVVKAPVSGPGEPDLRWVPGFEPVEVATPAQQSKTPAPRTPKYTNVVVLAPDSGPGESHAGWVPGFEPGTSEVDTAVPAQQSKTPAPRPPKSTNVVVQAPDPEPGEIGRVPGFEPGRSQAEVPVHVHPHNVQQPNPVGSALAQPIPSRSLRNKPRVDYGEALGQQKRKSGTDSIPLLHPGLTDETFAKLFEDGKSCDLCGRGPSLALGLWINWCCGMLSSDCSCTPSAQNVEISKFVNSTTTAGNRVWPQGKAAFGKLHLKCVLWLNNVKWNIMDPKDVPQGTKRFFPPQDLKDAMAEGHDQDKGLCSSCGVIGATITCLRRPQVVRCRRRYHYPCAEQVSRQDQNYLRMWTGPFERNEDKIICPDCIYEIEVQETVDERSYFRDRPGFESYVAFPRYPGVNRIHPDISKGLERFPIPVFNDIDPAHPDLPQFTYTTVFVNKHGKEAFIRPTGRENVNMRNQGCGGCAAYSNERADEPVSPHFRLQIPNLKRFKDKRQDWQGVAMFGRLCYDTNNLLQLRTCRSKIDGQGTQNEFSIAESGYFLKDIVECNLREDPEVCKCVPRLQFCQNSILPRGIQKRIELFKTEHKFWGIRAAERILRGQFVMEYVGELISQRDSAARVRRKQDHYLFDLDHHPELESGDAKLLSVDGNTFSNVSRFLNHSCTGNVEVFRVYIQTLDVGYYRLGFYAGKDIRPGEELTLDYNYTVDIDPDDPERANNPDKILCKCKSGTKCRIWMR